jgi:hypothetical protein
LAQRGQRAACQKVAPRHVRHRFLHFAIAARPSFEMG